MKKWLMGLFVLGFMFTISGIGITANTATHQVTIKIIAVDELTISGDNITLPVNSTITGSVLKDATDNTCSLDWVTNSPNNKKITGQLDADYSVGMSLAVSATVTGGNGAGTGQQTLMNTSAVDIVTGMHNEKDGSSVVDYTTSASGDFFPSETWTVMYTITDQ